MNTLILTAITALAPPFGVNVGGNQATLTINAATAIAEPFRINLGGTAGTNQAKFAPTRGTPIIVYWGQSIGANSRIWRDKSSWVCNKVSFRTDYYPSIPGYPTPPSISEVNVDGGCAGVNNYATLNPSTYKLDVDAEHLQHKIDVHAAHDAQLICDCIHKQGLIRGHGPVGGGDYGGAFTHHELFSDGSFWEENASWSFTDLLRHPDDAALVPRTQSLKIDECNYREDAPTTLFKLLPGGGVKETYADQIQTIEGRAEIEARWDGVRPGNFHHLICTNGIAAAKQYAVALRDSVKALCDAYTPPGETCPIQLCYPAYVLSSLEDFSQNAALHQTRFLNRDNPLADPPAHDPLWAPPDPPGIAGYYLAGALWHVMGNHDCPNPTWTSKIFESGEDYQVAESYKSAIEGDPVISSYSRFCPNVTSGINPNEEQSVHFGRLNFHAADYAIYKALNEPWKEELPETEFSNYDMVIVKSDATETDWYRRPSESGRISIQKILRQDNQAPSFYGNYGKDNPLVRAIRFAGSPEATAEAVTAWNDTYYPLLVAQILNVIDEKRPVDAYVYGVYTPEDLQSDSTNPKYEWGGDKAFFKKLVKTLWLRGIYKYVIFSGDPEQTFDAWNEVQAEIRDGNFA